MEKYILVIGGPLCSGKTTISDLILKKKKRLYRPSYDKLKSQLSDFNSEGDREFIMSLLLSLCNEVVKNDISLLVEGSSSIMSEMRSFYDRFAKAKGFKYVEVSIEASKEELLRRFALRVAEGRAQTVTTEEQFMSRYNRYMEKKNPNCIVYDSEKLSAEAIADSIIELL